MPHPFEWKLRGSDWCPSFNKTPERGEDPGRARPAARNKGRTQAERFFTRVKGEFGGRKIYDLFRGNNKVMTHLMYGILAIFAEQLLAGVS